MAQEIERKFLVKGEFKSKAKKQIHITQGYLSSIPERTVRVRLKEDQGFITIKGISNAAGTNRYEWEKEILKNEAEDLLKICEEGIIDKTRFLIDVGNHTFEVDEFYGKNEGLIIAEIELTSEDEKFEKPKWLGKEVSGDVKYFNSNLMQNPFKNWSAK